MKKALKFTLKVIIVLFVLLNVVVVFHAYKFTHFYEAGEVEIKQQTSKSGWDIAQEMFFGINSVKQKNTAPDSSFSTVLLTTKDGLQLEAWFIKVPNAKGSIAMFHGHGSKKSAILEEATAFQKMGYNTFLLDFRAHGNSDGNTCTIGVDEGEDVKLAFDYLQKNGEKNIILWGISLGAATITQAINDYEILPNKIILEMPFGSLPQAVAGRVKMMGLPTQPISTLLTFWGGVEHGFWAFNMKPYEYAKKIKCPVLMQKGKHDPRVTDAEVEAIYKNISTDKKMVYYENSGHQSLCNNEQEKWTTEVNAFLQK
jgi:alpha-beta hydrolase superfamily lysophospholipase